MAARPWHEPSPGEGYSVQVDRIHAWTRWSLTAGNRTNYAGARLDLRAYATAGQTAAFAIKRVDVDELRDDAGADLLPVCGSKEGERRIYVAASNHGSIYDLFIAPLRAVPESISVFRGRIEIIELGEPTVIDIPFVVQPRWTPVPGVEGLSTMIPRVEVRSEDIIAEVLTRVDVKPGEDSMNTGPPYVVRSVVVTPDGNEQSVASRAYGETLVAGGVVNSFTAQTHNKTPDAAKIRLCVVKDQTSHTVPFEFRGLPLAGDAVSSTPAQPPSAVASAAIMQTDEQAAPVRPVEKQGMLLSPFWVESEMNAETTPGSVKIDRKISFTATVQDLVSGRLYTGKPALTLTEVTDENGENLLPLAAQTEEEYNAPPGFVRPIAGDSASGGQLKFELRGPGRLPRRLGTMKGHITIGMGGAEKAVRVPLEPSDEPRPMAEYPAISVQVKSQKIDKGRLTAEVLYRRPMPARPKPASKNAYVRPRTTAEAEPPFIVAWEARAADGHVTWRQQAPQEWLSGDFANGSMYISCAFDAESTLHAVVVDSLEELRIDFDYRDVPVAGLP